MCIVLLAFHFLFLRRLEVLAHESLKKLLMLPAQLGSGYKEIDNNTILTLISPLWLKDFTSILEVLPL